MSYSSQAALSVDPHFYNRVSACAAVEVPASGLSVTPPVPTGPEWAMRNVWAVAAAPGFADAYEYALNTSVEDPGNDPAVITDAQILAAVQGLLPPMPPPPEESELNNDGPPEEPN